MIADEIEIPVETDLVPEIYRLRLEIGDIVVAKFRRKLTPEMVDRFTRYVSHLAPGVEVLCIHGDLELSLINRDKIPKDVS